MIRLWRITGPGGIGIFSDGWLLESYRRGIITRHEYLNAWDHPDGTVDIPEFNSLPEHDKRKYLFAFQSKKYY